MTNFLFEGVVRDGDRREDQNPVLLTQLFGNRPLLICSGRQNFVYTWADSQPIILTSSWKLNSIKTSHVKMACSHLFVSDAYLSSDGSPQSLTVRTVWVSSLPWLVLLSPLTSSRVETLSLWGCSLSFTFIAACSSKRSSDHLSHMRAFVGPGSLDHLTTGWLDRSVKLSSFFSQVWKLCCLVPLVKNCLPYDQPWCLLEVFVLFLNWRFLSSPTLSLWKFSNMQKSWKTRTISST